MRLSAEWMIVAAIFVAQPGGPARVDAHDATPVTVRVATYNVSLYRDRAGQLQDDLRDGLNEQARQVAGMLQLVRPDIVLLNEFDFDETGEAVRLFCDRYLAVGQGDGQPLSFPYRFTAPVNTGEPSGIDLNQDGRNDGPNDAYGFGRFPGQYGMVVLSRWPIAVSEVRTFRMFLWRDMPDARLPRDPRTQRSYYSEQQLAVLRLSSKSHWDLPVDISGRRLHILAAHPTPPAFDGPEDRNGCRNHDEIRLWADYIAPERSGYIVDDQGLAGGLAAGSSFVIVGDYNADPLDGGSVPGAIQQLLDHPLVQAEPVPLSSGGAIAAQLAGGVNSRHQGDPRFDTAAFSGSRGPGNLRADYVLPSRNLRVSRCGVFWPAKGEPGAELLTASDHRPVWVELDWHQGATGR